MVVFAPNNEVVDVADAELLLPPPKIEPAGAELAVEEAAVDAGEDPKNELP